MNRYPLFSETIIHSILTPHSLLHGTFHSTWREFAHELTLLKTFSPFLAEEVLLLLPNQTIPHVFSQLIIPFRRELLVCQSFGFSCFRRRATRIFSRFPFLLDALLLNGKKASNLFLPLSLHNRRQLAMNPSPTWKIKVDSIF